MSARQGSCSLWVRLRHGTDDDIGFSIVDGINGSRSQQPITNDTSSFFLSFQLAPHRDHGGCPKEKPQLPCQSQRPKLHCTIAHTRRKTQLVSRRAGTVCFLEMTLFASIRLYAGDPMFAGSRHFIIAYRTCRESARLHQIFQWKLGCGSTYPKSTLLCLPPPPSPVSPQRPGEVM